MTTSSPPPHARPFHTIHTPRLLIRSCKVSDAKVLHTLRTEPLNNPFGGVREPDITVAVQAERLADSVKTTAEGKNGWVVAIIKDPKPHDEAVEALRVEEGILIGNSGFNAFPLMPTVADPSKEAMAGNIGVMVDYRFIRKGYAIEITSAVIEYGFGELGCEMMALETNFSNGPFRAMMKNMGIEETSIVDNEEEKEVRYHFDKEMWERAKVQMKANGKWYL